MRTTIVYNYCTKYSTMSKEVYIIIINRIKELSRFEKPEKKLGSHFADEQILLFDSGKCEDEAESSSASGSSKTSRLACSQNYWYSN